MGVNITNTSAAATGTPRQFRIILTVEIDGATTNHDLLFPDDLQTWATQGYFTAAELRDRLMDVCLWAARRRAGKGD